MRTCDECHSAVESARAVDRSFLEMTADAYTIAHRLALDLTIQDDPWNDKARKRALFRAFEMLASPPDDVLNVMHGPPFFQAGTYLEFILSFFSSFATDSSFADAKIHGESLPRLAFVNAGFFERFGESILAQMIEAFNLAISSKALRLSNDPARIIRGYADPDVVARIRNRIADMIFVIEQLHRLSDLVNVHTAQMRYEMTRTCVGAIFWLVAFLNVNVRASLSAANYLGIVARVNNELPDESADFDTRLRFLREQADLGSMRWRSIGGRRVGYPEQTPIYTAFVRLIRFYDESVVELENENRERAVSLIFDDVKSSGRVSKTTFAFNMHDFVDCLHRLRFGRGQSPKDAEQTRDYAREVEKRMMHIKGVVRMLDAAGRQLLTEEMREISNDDITPNRMLQLSTETRDMAQAIDRLVDHTYKLGLVGPRSIRDLTQATTDRREAVVDNMWRKLPKEYESSMMDMTPKSEREFQIVHVLRTLCTTIVEDFIRSSESNTEVIDRLTRAIQDIHTKIRDGERIEEPDLIELVTAQKAFDLVSPDDREVRQRDVRIMLWDFCDVFMRNVERAKRAART